MTDAENTTDELSDNTEIPDDVEDYDLIEDEALSPEALSDLVLYTLDWSGPG